MSTSNVVKQINLPAVRQRSWRAQWRVYKAAHSLAREYSAARQGRQGKVMQFVQRCLRPGPIAVIDSFAPAVELIHPVARWIELENSATVLASWHPEVESSIFPQEHSTYSTVIMLGETWTKYITPAEYAQRMSGYQSWLQPNGNLLVCMPVTHMIYHRLCYSVEQVIQQVDLALPDNFKIRQHQLHGLNVYLEIGS